MVESGMLGNRSVYLQSTPVFLLCHWLPVQASFLVSAQHHEGPSTEDVEDTALPAISDLAYTMTINSEKISYILMSVHILSHLIYATTF